MSESEFYLIDPSKRCISDFLTKDRNHLKEGDFIKAARAVSKSSNKTELGKIILKENRSRGFPGLVGLMAGK